MDTPRHLEPLLDASEVARILRVHPRTVLRLARAGLLPGVRYARHWRFQKADIAARLESRASFSGLSLMTARTTMRNLRQHGSLRLRQRVHGSSVWEFRCRSTDKNGRRRLKSTIISSVKDYPTEALARQKIQGLMLAINNNAVCDREPEVSALLDRFIAEERLEEIVAGEKEAGAALHYSTARSYLTLINKYVRPRWGLVRLDSLRPAAIQQWLNEIAAAPKSKANIRALLHRLYEKAMFWELIELQRNPIELIEIKGVSRRTKRPTVLPLEQF